MKITGNLKKGCLLALAGLLAIPGLTLMQAQAAGEIDVNAACSLTVSIDKTVLMDSETAGDDALLRYKDDFAKVEIPVSIYRVAEVDAVGKYTGIDEFTEMDFSVISSGTTAADWMTLAEQATELIDKTKPDPDGTESVKTAEGSSDAASATFTDLPTGMYLVAPEETFNEMYTVKYVFTPYLTSLPGNPYATGGGTGDDAYGEGEDQWEYDTTIGLKAAAEPQVGKLIIEKTLRNYNQSLGPVSFVFQIEGRDSDGMVVYKQVVSTTHIDADTQRVTLENIPAGIKVTVTEIYSGASYTFDSDTVVSDLLIWSDEAVKQKEDGNEDPAIEDAKVPVASFFNKYDDEGNKGGYGITNYFEKDENGGWTHSTSNAENED